MSEVDYAKINSDEADDRARRGDEALHSPGVEPAEDSSIPGDSE